MYLYVCHAIYFVSPILHRRFFQVVDRVPLFRVPRTPPMRGGGQDPAYGYVSLPPKGSSVGPLPPPS